MPDFDLPAYRGRSYRRDELLDLRCADVTPPRPVHKAILATVYRCRVIREIRRNMVNVDS